MIKKVGQLIELDATKKYVMVVKSGALEPEDVKLLNDALVAQQDSLVTIVLPELDCIEFVENTDRVFDVVAEDDIKSKDSKA